MAQDSNLSNLLKWSIENSTDNPSEDTSSRPPRPIDPAALSALFGGPSDADLMKQSMATILSPEVDLDSKLTAFDNFEQLIESLDNANNMAPLGLWTPLLDQLSHQEPDVRLMAAWCVGTAVQNNPDAQERALVGGAVPVLVRMMRGDKRESEEKIRRKARYALSSMVRNYQPGVEAVLKAMGNGPAEVDAGDMDAVDRLLEELIQ
jgi:hsp70-interacting protein